MSNNVEMVAISKTEVDNLKAYKKIADGVAKLVYWIFYGFIATGLLYLGAFLEETIYENTNILDGISDVILLVAAMIFAIAFGKVITKLVTDGLFKVVVKKLNK